MASQYDWPAIRREWETGEYASPRQLAAGLPFRGLQAPSHVAIWKRIRDEGWERSLEPEIRAERERKLQVLGVPNAADLPTRERIREAADRQVAIVQEQQLLVMDARDRLSRTARLHAVALAKVEERAAGSRGLFLDRSALDELIRMDALLMRNLNALVELQNQVFGLRAGAAGESETDDPIEGARAHRVRAEAVLGVLAGAIGAARADRAEVGDVFSG